MSGLKPYPAYKDSGFEWLPEVPTHWVDRKIARDVPFVVGWTPASGKDEYYDGDLAWVTIADMTQESVEDTKSKISQLAVKDKGAKIVPAGSMLFSFKLSVGKIAFLTIDSYTNEAIAGFPDSELLDLEYWKYAAPEFIPRYGRENIYGAILLNQELISSVRFFAPMRAEQSKIARFLNHETARIDALIAEQQRLIELLKEKRQAVISHAVTKGLDPMVPMKDSGVEWLGEVPAHWDVLNFNLLVHIAEGQVNPRVSPYSEMLLIAPNHIESATGRLIYTETAEEQGADSGKYLCQENDVIYSKIRPILRKVCIAPEACLCSADMYPMRGHSGLENEYLFWFILSEFFSAFALLESDRVAMPKINRESLGGLKLARPPLEEQKRIAAFLMRETHQIDALIDKADSGVRLLNERRAALISAAVTGKIDVRGWQPPARAQALKPSR